MSSPRITITREVQLDIGHRIPFHKARCFNVHGHRCRIVATLEGPVIVEPGRSDDGMVVDFGDLKEILIREVHDPLDHGFLVWENDQPLRGFLEQQGFRVVAMQVVPTAENIAKWCHDRVAARVRERYGDTVTLKTITVWETPNCSATFPAE